MDVKVSWFAVCWKRIWGGKEAVCEYLLDKANLLVAQLPGATKEKLLRAYKVAKTIQGYIVRYAWLVPQKWLPYYTAVMNCFSDILVALEDMKVTSDELNRLVESFRKAYAVWMEDDTEEASAGTPLQ